MVRAILQGRKTQTRRIIGPAGFSEGAMNATRQFELENGIWYPCSNLSLRLKGLKCPYGVTGDKLWVRESWRQGFAETNYSKGIIYMADKPKSLGMAEYCGRWKSPIYMHRSDSRITLEISDVRVQRVQDITEGDAKAEGVESRIAGVGHPDEGPSKTYRTGFVRTWVLINGGGAWDFNPWVWAISFKVIG